MKTLYSRETPKVLRGMRDKPNVTVGDVSPGFPHRRQQRYKKSYHQGWKAKGPAYNTEDLSPWKYSSGEESGTDYSAWTLQKSLFTSLLVIKVLLGSLYCLVV